jgi:hypothetical protein
VRPPANPTRTVAALACGLLLATSALAADDADVERLAFMVQSADDYRFETALGDKREITRVSAPLLRWDNQIVREDDAALFLWVRDKRPVCAAQLFLQGDVWHHEFQSLTDQRFRALWRDGKAWTWSPQRSGIAFQRADLDPPSAKAPLRLRQMRSFAEQFTATTDPSGVSGAQSGSRDLHQLRLLTSPVYRYADDQKLLDGAIFVFAQGTNPEVLLLIEAVKDDAGGHWQFAFAPMTSFAAEVKQDNQSVWSQEVVDVRTQDPQGPYRFRFAVLPRDENGGSLAPVTPHTSR